MAKRKLGKVNLELMLPAVLPSLHMICGGASLEFAGANLIQPCSLAIVAISTFVSESLWINKPHPPFPGGYLTSEVSIGLGISTELVSVCWRLFMAATGVVPACWVAMETPAVPGLPRALPC